MSKRIVGITVGLKSIDESLWVNGIKLNAAMLYLLINEIDGYEAVIVDTSGNIEDLSKINFWDTSIFKTESFSSIAKDLDVLIELGTSFSDQQVEQLKKQGLKAKLVRYQCGNNYVIEMERVIFGDEDSPAPTWSTHQDQTWYVPQQHKHNRDYYSITSRGDAFPVPFVWDPYFINQQKDEIEKISNNKVEYYPTDRKKIMSFEPNNNVVKYSMPLILIAEEAYRNGHNFDDYTVCSGRRMFNNKGFLNAIQKLEIFKDGKLKYLDRYPIVRLLTTDVDFVISHQWDNPLNYLYLDVMYLNYPLIHNAHMVQDGGYYYSDFNLKEGAEKLSWALENHDKNIRTYNKKNKKVLHRYMKENRYLLKTYKKLLDNLFNPETHMLSYEYDWQTNNYK